jgi:hypothetical protein
MPFYHFHFVSNSHSVDGGALDLADDDAARMEAELEASDLRSNPGEGDWSRYTIRVTDQAGRVVASVAVAELMPSDADQPTAQEMQ